MKTDICGVELENPFILGSAVVASSYKMCKAAFEAGWAGASLKTISSFMQNEASPRFSCVYDNSHSFLGFKNIEQLSTNTLEEDYKTISKLKEEFPSKVVIASIMGRDANEWAMIAKGCQDAGADLIECNYSCPNLEDQSLGKAIGQSRRLIKKYTKAVKDACDIPVLAKLTPNVADMVPYAIAAKEAGADGISAINTINSFNGVNKTTFSTEPDVKGFSIQGGYSGRAVKPIALNFVSSLTKDDKLSNLSICGIGGIETWNDAVDFILMGSSSVQVVTSVMEYGYRIVEDMIDGLKRFMKSNNFKTINQVVGLSKKSIVPHNKIDRSTILLPKFVHDRCIGCGRCYISCSDGGHQAIEFDEKNRRPRLIAKKCVGCHLCKLVCSQQAIVSAKKRFK